MLTGDDLQRTNDVKCNKFIPRNHVLWPFFCSGVQKFHEQIDVSLDERLLFSHSLFGEGVRKYPSHPAMFNIAHHVENAFYISG